MKKGGILGLVFVGVLVLVTVWMYNHFSDAGISELGKPKAA